MVSVKEFCRLLSRNTEVVCVSGINGDKSEFRAGNVPSGILDDCVTAVRVTGYDNKIKIITE